MRGSIPDVSPNATISMFRSEGRQGHRALGGRLAIVAVRIRRQVIRPCAIRSSCSRRDGLAADLGSAASCAGARDGLERPGHGEQCAGARRRFRPKLSGLEGTLKQLFGYNQFEVIGQSRKTLQDRRRRLAGVEQIFLAPRRFERRRRDSGYLLNLQFFQDEKLLLETDAKLSKSSPLVISGPQVGDGQLLLLLVVQ